MKNETVGETLQRLARASLPRFVDDGVDKNARRRCACGELIPYNYKKRQNRPVCDDCARMIPKAPSGRPSTLHCCGCGTTTPRLKMKVKAGKLYCKKCLKIKFNIDF